MFNALSISSAKAKTEADLTRDFFVKGVLTIYFFSYESLKQILSEAVANFSVVLFLSAQLYTTFSRVVEMSASYSLKRKIWMQSGPIQNSHVQTLFCE